MHIWNCLQRFADFHLFVVIIDKLCNFERNNLTILVFTNVYAAKNRNSIISVHSVKWNGQSAAVWTGAEMISTLNF